MILSGRRRERRVMLAALLLLLPLAAAEVSAQQIVGTVVDRSTQQPVPNASVLILNPDSSLRHALLSDERGRFSTPSTIGHFLVRAAGFGYAPVWSQPVELRRDDTADFLIQLPPQPLELAGVENFAEEAWYRALDRRLDPNGFYDRMQSEPGRFLTPEQIDRRKPNQVGDLFAGIPGVVVDTDGRGTLLVGRRGCTPTVFVNRLRIPPDAVQGVDGMYIEQFVRPRDIRGVEVYSNPEFAPGLFLTSGGGGCSIVAIWTYLGVEVDVPEDTPAASID